MKNHTLEIEIVPGVDAAFDRREYEARMSAARKSVDEAGLDALVVTSPENIFYLTGQQTPGYYIFQALVIPVDADPIFIVRELEYYNFRANTFIRNVKIFSDADDPIAVLIAALRLGKFRRVGVEKRGWFFPVCLYETLLERFGSVGNGSGIVERLRVVKSAEEVRRLEIAAQYADLGMTAGFAAIRPGTNENAVAAAILQAMVSAGSEYLAMEPLVTAGQRTGLPHGMWRRHLIGDAGPVLLSVAGCRDRYHAAIMRTAWVGAAPSSILDMEKTCQEALDEAIHAIRPGEPCEAGHLACQRIIDRDGYSENFRKRAGYSMGIAFAPDWGEGGILSLYTGSRTELQPGMAFHIPVALRVFGESTVAVSETVVVTETGCRTLSAVARNMFNIRN